MKSSQTPDTEKTSTKEPGLWEIFLVREDGDWAGFRMGVQTLRRLSNFFILGLCLLSLSLLGWVFARWKMAEYKRELSFTRLELKSVSHELQALQKSLSGVEGGVTVSQLMSDIEKESSILPTLEARDRSSAVMALENFKAQYEIRSQNLEISFSLERKPPREGPRNYYWLLLLHGPQGVLSFPSAFTSRGGEVLLFHRGRSVEVKQPSEKITESFSVPEFVKQAGAEPIYATVLLYDDKGSLILRQRRGLEVSQ